MWLESQEPMKAAGKNHKVNRAARRLATLFENYVAKLAPEEQEARYQAFERAVNRALATAKMGNTIIVLTN